jgi:hypothetical protein
MSTSPVPNNLDLNAAIHPHNSPSLEKPKELEDEGVDLSASQTVAVPGHTDKCRGKKCHALVPSLLTPQLLLVANPVLGLLTNIATRS